MEMGRSIGNSLGHNGIELGFWSCVQERVIRRDNTRSKTKQTKTSPTSGQPRGDP